MSPMFQIQNSCDKNSFKKKCPSKMTDAGIKSFEALLFHRRLETGNNHREMSC